jgi:hypothetical protein
VNAPTTIEGAACWQAAMLCLVPGFAGLHLDVPAALRVAESLGAEARVAIPLLGMIRDGMHEGFAKQRAASPRG